MHVRSAISNPAAYQPMPLLYNEHAPAGPAIPTMESGYGEVILLLQEVRKGLPDAKARLLKLVYAELRKIAGFHLLHDRPGHTLQPTALVNEACLRLTRARLANLNDREHFFAVASSVIRRILVDHARSYNAHKRRGHRVQESLVDVPLRQTTSVEELLALDSALSRLATWDTRQSQIVEMRFFGGLTEEEIARVLNISSRTVKREWAMARAWLQSHLER
jgi:RNA polymerase sigma factor (TIGR02999 family)